LGDSEGVWAEEERENGDEGNGHQQAQIACNCKRRSGTMKQGNFLAEGTKARKKRLHLAKT